MTAAPLRLGVNIDHVATVRNARGGDLPDPVRAAQIALLAGADGITAHLREDRRHISDLDIERLSDLLDASGRPLNLEMAVTDEMIAIALDHRPHAVCLVPERREERTTEGGLDVAGQADLVAGAVEQLREAGSRVSLFIGADPDPDRDCGGGRGPGRRTAYRGLLRLPARRQGDGRPARRWTRSGPAPPGRPTWGWRFMPGTAWITRRLRCWRLFPRWLN
jgi:hypothetical protein